MFRQLIIQYGIVRQPCGVIAVVRVRTHLAMHGKKPEDV